MPAVSLSKNLFDEVAYQFDDIVFAQHYKHLAYGDGAWPEAFDFETEANECFLMLCQPLNVLLRQADDFWQAQHLRRIGR